MDAIKPSFLTVFNAHQMSMWDLHLHASISPSIISAALVGIAMRREMAEKLVDGINELRHTHYTVDSIRFELIPEGGNDDRTAINGRYASSYSYQDATVYP